MSRKSVVVRLRLVCALTITCSACRIYNASLLEESRQIPTPKTVTRTSDRWQLADVCGNGVVDDAETCDIAIDSDQPGACPTRCDLQIGCFGQELIGTRCHAFCLSLEITAPLDNDQCCPNGADHTIDSDCSALCGNGLLDAAETCDPPETCPKQELCRSDDACKPGFYAGDPQQCTATCEFHSITDCQSGDGCCPAQCTAANDNDCSANNPEPPKRPTGTDNTGNPGTNPPPPDAGSPCDAGNCPDDGSNENPATCTQAHTGGRCQACDCNYCASQTVACLDPDPPTRNASLALIECATRAHCSGVDCYCGPFTNDLALCARWAGGGPCVREIRSLTRGDSDPVQVLLNAVNTNTPLGRVAQMLACRAQNCREVCGL